MAFARSWSDCGGGVCGYGGSDLWEGRPRGPFKRFAFAPYPGCANGGVSFDVDGPTIAYSEGFCRRGEQRTRVVLRDLGLGSSVELENAPAKTHCCEAVTIAGRFVAWRAGRAIVVYDVAARRTVYRAALPEGSQRAVAFDLGTDGTLVAAIDNRRGITNEDAVPVGMLYRFVPGRSAPRAYRLRGHAMLDLYGRRLRFGDGRLLFDRRLTARTSELVLSDLAGHGRRLAFFQPGERLVGDLSMTPERVAWASRKDTEIRRVCGIETCRDVADGAVTIWSVRSDRRGSKEQAIARRPYTGLRPLN